MVTVLLRLLQVAKSLTPGAGAEEQKRVQVLRVLVALGAVERVRLLVLQLLREPLILAQAAAVMGQGQQVLAVQE